MMNPVKFRAQMKGPRKAPPSPPAIQELNGCPCPHGCFVGHPVSDGDCGPFVRLLCTSEVCPFKDELVHQKCFDAYEGFLMNILEQKKDWTETKRKANIWMSKGQKIIIKYCKCRCGKGTITQDRTFSSDTHSLDKKKKPRKKKDLPELNNSHRWNETPPKVLEQNLRKRERQASLTSHPSSPPALPSSDRPQMKMRLTVNEEGRRGKRNKQHKKEKEERIPVEEVEEPTKEVSQQMTLTMAAAPPKLTESYAATIKGVVTSPRKEISPEPSEWERVYSVPVVLQEVCREYCLFSGPLCLVDVRGDSYCIN